MSSQYFSMLIAKLYSAVNEENGKDIEETLREIGDSGDPIFLYPVYENYKKNKISSLSHLFVARLNDINSNEVIQLAIEIGENPINNVDRNYTLQIFDKRKYYERRATEIALRSLSIFIEKIGDIYDLYMILPFFRNAEILNVIESKMYSIFNNEKFSTDVRVYVFRYWLEIEPTQKLQSIIDEFSELKRNSTKESIIAKGIIGWKGAKIEELKILIEKEGGVQAKHIIASYREKEKETEQIARENKQHSVKKQYSNADFVEKICTLREKINDFTKSDQNIGFTLFPPNEAMFSQLKTANDNASLMKACVGLREIIQNLNDELGKHGLNTEEIKPLLPNTAEEDYNKSLNKLFLFLHSKKYELNSDVFGLIKLNQLVGLLGAHPQSEKEKLMKKLKDLNLEKAYQDEEWAKIHQNILEQYEKSLNLLFNALKNE